MPTMRYCAAVARRLPPSPQCCESLPSLVLSVGIWMLYNYVAIAYANEDHLTQATEVVHFIAAEGTGYPPPLVLNLEPEGPHRFLELYIKCVGTAIVVSFYNKVANDWIRTGSTVQVRLPSASSSVS